MRPSGMDVSVLEIAGTATSRCSVTGSLTPAAVTARTSRPCGASSRFVRAIVVAPPTLVNRVFTYGLKSSHVSTA